MASVNLSLTVVAVLFSGFLILGAVGEADVEVDVDVEVNVCFQLCADGWYTTCSGSGDVRQPWCSCNCGPPDGQDCVVYSPDDTPTEYCS